MTFRTPNNKRCNVFIFNKIGTLMVVHSHSILGSKCCPRLVVVTYLIVHSSVKRAHRRCTMLCCSFIVVYSIAAVQFTDSLSLLVFVMAIVGQLTKVLTMIRQEVCLRVKNPSSSDGEKLTSKLNKLMKHHLSECLPDLHCLRKTAHFLFLQ